MSWNPDSLSPAITQGLSPAMLDILAWIKSGYVLESRLAPNWDGKPPSMRYWLRRPHQTNSLRIQLSTVTVNALKRRGLL